MPKGKRRSRGPMERAVFEQIDRVRRHRRPFADLAARLIEQVMGSANLPPQGPIVEIGAGDGQLRQWLSSAWHPRLIHTECRPLGVQKLRRADPCAVVEQASAEQLPYADGQLAAVIALCVLDTVDDGGLVARELARVLKPGGCVIHWLDMTTELSAAIKELRQSNIVLLPNVFTDPCAQPWPDDLFLIPRAQLDLVIEILRGAEHPGWRELNRYRANYMRRPFSAARAVGAFNALNDDPVARRGLVDLLGDAMRRADPRQRATLGRFEGRPVCSARFFSGRLQQWFTSEFSVECDDILTAAQTQPRPASSPYRYLSLATGFSRQRSELPSSYLSASPPPVGDDERLVELGMHVFVARRRPTG